MKFLWYNDGYIRTYLSLKRNEQGAKEYCLGGQEYKNLYQLYKLFDPTPWGVLHDNTGHIQHPFNITIKNQYNYQKCNKTFGEVCLDVARKIYHGTDKKISVNWSGGIDSTAMLVALLQVVPHNELIVVCNQASVDEFPTFYKDVVKNQIETIDVRTWSDQATDFFCVSGDGGDNLWAQFDQAQWNAQHQLFALPWTSYIDPDQVSLSFVEEFCSWSGVKIQSVLDLRTWTHLCCKWQEKATKIYRDRPGLTISNGSSFFDYDTSFQNWTMSNLNLIASEQWANYKMPAKEFIFNYYPDKNYLANKTKEDSSSILLDSALWTIKNKCNKFAIDSDYVSHTLPSWPFIDPVQFENWNDQYHLIPNSVLEI